MPETRQSPIIVTPKKEDRIITPSSTAHSAHTRMQRMLSSSSFAPFCVVECPVIFSHILVYATSVILAVSLPCMEMRQETYKWRSNGTQSRGEVVQYF